MRFFVKFLLGMMLLTLLCSGGGVVVLWFASNWIAEQIFQTTDLDLPTPAQTEKDLDNVVQQILTGQEVRLSAEDVESLIWNHPESTFSALDIEITSESLCHVRASIPMKNELFVNITMLFDAELQNKQFTRYDLHLLQIGNLDAKPWLEQYTSPQELANITLNDTMLEDPELNTLISSIQQMHIEDQQLVIQLKEEALPIQNSITTEDFVPVAPPAPPQ